MDVSETRKLVSEISKVAGEIDQSSRIANCMMRLLCPNCGATEATGKIEFVYYPKLESVDCSCDCGHDWSQLVVTVDQVIAENNYHGKNG